MATQNLPQSNPCSRISKTKNEKSQCGVVRDLSGKSILLVNDKTVGEIQRKSDLHYNPGAVVGDISTGVICISYLHESLSNSRDTEIEDFVARGFSIALFKPVSFAVRK